MATFYIFVNSNLALSKGQLCAQVSHITQIITEELVKQCYETNPPSPDCIAYMKWKRSPKTVVLKATPNQLTTLLKHPTARGFIDSGNRLPDDSLTVVGFYPSETMDEIVKDYKLV